MSNDSVVSKTIVGYCDRWSVRAGEPVTLHVSAEHPGPIELSLVRLVCGDPTRYGPGFQEHPVDLAAGAMPPSVEPGRQTLTPGSFAWIDLAGLEASRSLVLRLAVMLTRVEEPQTLFRLEGGPGLELTARSGVLELTVGTSSHTLRPQPLAGRRWYEVEVALDPSTGRLDTAVSTRPSRSPGRDLLESTGPFETQARTTPIGPIELESLQLAGRHGRGELDGRLGGLSLRCDDTELVWDFSADMHTRRLVETSRHGRHGELHQLPTRAVTGPRWDSSEQRWSADPGQWDAAHFHKDDLYDAGWEPTATVTLPDDIPSGIYAFRLVADHGQDRIPIFVRPAVAAPTEDVALLMSSATYLAYANHRMLIEGLDFIAARSRLRPEHEYIRTHPEIGHSMYEKHPDGSGVMFSSRLRPVLNLRPGADGWNFTPDTDINAFLEHELGSGDRPGHDVISDEDVHAEGLAALAPYRVIVTCSHPEYWSTAMLDALDAWQRQGGRLMYLGGNGLYWRVAFSDHWPGAMELRRAEDGVRNWQTGDGESYHAFGGEYGGMWRRLGRPPNELVGIGFAAQGFDRASSYVVDDDSRRGRTAWMWDGVDDDDGRIGTSGIGGGAAGQEVDRYDTRLGSPAHAVVLASASEFSSDMVRTKEEFEGSVIYPVPDPYVRSDIVFYETPAGGAVFSVGSISWFGALAREGYDNDIARLTANVLHRFADATPFPSPTDTP